MSNTILIVDDHAMVRQGIRQFLEKNGYVIVAEAGSGEDACQAWREYHPELVLMDMDMPGIGGIEALKRILLQDVRARVLMYSMYADAVHSTRALQSGARGYVAKSEPPELLLEAIRQTLRGGRYIGHEVARNMTASSIMGSDDPIKALSPREFEVFRRLAAGQSITDISGELHISIKSVSNIQTRIRQKLNLSSPAQLVTLAIRHGITRSNSPQDA